MNLPDVQAQLEQELTWRRNELRFLTNVMLGLPDNADQRVFRKALVVMLYAHFEGFSKAALTVFVRTVNNENLESGQLNDSLAAAALQKVFAGLNGASKSPIFSRALPSDEPLHRLSRQIEFLSNLPLVLAIKPAAISEDIVDPESNLKPIVLRKNLFRLGLRHDAFEAHDGTIHQLLKRRNDVAHGAKVDGLTPEEFEPLQKAVYSIMDEIKSHVIDALSEKLYMRGSTAASPPQADSPSVAS